MKITTKIISGLCPQFHCPVKMHIPFEDSKPLGISCPMIEKGEICATAGRYNRNCPVVAEFVQTLSENQN